jgi:hypothetical protein
MAHRNDKTHETQTKENQSMDSCWWHNPSTVNFILAAFTFCLVIVGILQWCILRQTDQTSRLRDRAFIYFLNPTFFPYPPDKPIVWGISINLQNAGNMPARRISIRYGYTISEASANIVDPFPLATWADASVPNVIGPKQSFSLQGCEFPISIIEAAQKSEKNIFILMEAKYIDGFELDRLRVTQMSRSLRFDAHGGFSLGFAGPHNCTDDDCP